MSISAVLGVYNEEARIETTLRCATWCDEIIVFDKQSTDHTREIALKYTNKVFEIPYSEYDPNELQKMVDSVNSEWILWLTASEVLHRRLAVQIRDMVDQPDFPFDVIHVPYRRFILGLETERSPWYGELHPAVCRKHLFRVRQDIVHGAFVFDTTRHYKMANSTDYCMYHLTHETTDSMMEHHLRYWRAEARLFPSDEPLRKAFREVLSSFYGFAFKRKSYLMGWGGVTLGLAFMSYWMLRFVYIWERRRSAAPQTYRRVREMIMQSWVENAEMAKDYGGQ